jgi:NADH-quinone oxidoreductase subunit J
VVAQQISFWILAVVAVAAALAVVALKDVFRAAIALVACFLVIAGIYVLLSAEFLAVVQILIYVGAISVILMLAIMMTREYHRGSPSNKFRIPGFFVSLVFLGVVLYAVLNTTWNTKASPLDNPNLAVPTGNDLAIKLFGDGGFALPVVIGGMLLLAAILGAIILVKDRDK